MSDLLTDNGNLPRKIVLCGHGIFLESAAYLPFSLHIRVPLTHGADNFSVLRLPTAPTPFIDDSIDHSRMASLLPGDGVFNALENTDSHVTSIKAAIDMLFFDYRSTNQKSSQVGNRLSRFETFVEILDPGRISIRDPRLILHPFVLSLPAAAEFYAAHRFLLI